MRRVVKSLRLRWLVKTLTEKLLVGKRTQGVTVMLLLITKVGTRGLFVKTGTLTLHHVTLFL